MKKTAVLIIATLSVFFLGAIFFGLGVMGDRFCHIELQNSGQDDLHIKTIVSSGNEWAFIVDSFSLAPNERMILGQCINCTMLKPSDFDFDAIVIVSKQQATSLIHQKDLPGFLNSLERWDCATFKLP